MIKFDYLPYEPLRITSPFGRRKTGILGASTDHKGVDLGADKSRYRGNTDGGSVRAVLPYVVSESYYNKFRGWVVLNLHGLAREYKHLLFLKTQPIQLWWFPLRQQSFSLCNP